MRWRWSLKVEFKDAINKLDVFSIESSGQHIRLGISTVFSEGGYEQSFFYLDPKQFGDVAAALWECSPFTGAASESTNQATDSHGPTKISLELGTERGQEISLSLIHI